MRPFVLVRLISLRCRSNDCILPLFLSLATCKRARGGLPHRARVDKHRPEKFLPSSLVPSPRRRSIASCDLRGCMTLSLRSPSAMARRTVRRSVRTKSKTDQFAEPSQRQVMRFHRRLSRSDHPPSTSQSGVRVRRGIHPSARPLTPAISPRSRPFPRTSTRIES